MYQTSIFRVAWFDVQVPLAEMVGYASAVRSLTQGNVSFNMRFLQYQPVPQLQLKKLMAAPPL
jgi:elongation factor G